MKKAIISFLLSLSALSLAATHIYGSQISYRYVGDSSGIANHYRVTLDIFLECNGTATPTPSDSISIKISSSCYPTYYPELANLSSPSYSLIQFANYYTCIDSSQVACYGYQRFRGDVILPGLCPDFLFSFEICCRGTNIDNLTNSSSQYAYSSVSLNNYLGNNTSVQFKSDPVRTACTGVPISWRLKYSDADSLNFSLTSARGNNAVSLPYASGFSYNTPITTTLGGPVDLNSHTGHLTFTPTTSQTCIIGILVEEFTFDSTYFQWVKIASTIRDLLVVINGNCSPNAQSVNYDYNFYPPHSQNGLPTLQHPCFETVIPIYYVATIDSETASPNGSEYYIIGPNNQPVPIIGGVAKSNNPNDQDTVLLTLALPFQNNGLYLLRTKNGNDGNTIRNSCGFSQKLSDTLQINVTGCSGIGLDEEKLEQEPIIPTALRLGNAFSITIPETLAGDYQLSFYNLQGALLFTETFQGSGNWVAQNAGAIAKPGMYVCRLQSATQQDRQWQQKVVVLP
jgi:hypothetical protein